MNRAQSPVIAAQAAIQGHALAPARALHPLSTWWRGDRPKSHHTWPYPCGVGRFRGPGGEVCPTRRRPYAKNLPL